MANFKELLSNIKAFAFDVDGVLSQTAVPMSADGQPMRTANIKDGYAIQLACKLGYPMAIITGGKTEAVRIRYNNLGIKDIYMGQSTKLEAYNDFKKKYNLKDEEILYMGDDMPDLPLLKLAGAACVPADAVRDVIEIADYVSPYTGGNCCARDVIEQVLRLNGLWGKDISW